jgi:hypothetical protein
VLDLIQVPAAPPPKLPGKLTPFLSFFFIHNLKFTTEAQRAQRNIIGIKAKDLDTAFKT